MPVRRIEWFLNEYVSQDIFMEDLANERTKKLSSNGSGLEMKKKTLQRD